MEVFNDFLKYWQMFYKYMVILLYYCKKQQGFLTWEVVKKYPVYRTKIKSIGQVDCLHIITIIPDMNKKNLEPLTS